MIDQEGVRSYIRLLDVFVQGNGLAGQLVYAEYPRAT